jgi:hypothetical protein
LQLVEVGDDVSIRTDNQPLPEDTLPPALRDRGR